MIIAMDYGKQKRQPSRPWNCVLFADKEDQKKDIIIEKSSVEYLQKRSTF